MGREKTAESSWLDVQAITIGCRWWCELAAEKLDLAIWLPRRGSPMLQYARSGLLVHDPVCLRVAVDLVGLIPARSRLPAYQYRYCNYSS